MHIVAAVAALLLLLIALSPIFRRRFRLARRERAVHLDGGCHWYVNYDEDLRYEPHSGADIVRLRRDDVLRWGYQPTNDVQGVPRTFRNRVPGDMKIRLWKTNSSGAQHLWLCEWAMSPVRVAIGVGGRERVPGVESGRVPTHPEIPPERRRALDDASWSEQSSAPAPAAAHDSTLEVRAEERRTDVSAGGVAGEAASAEGVAADDAASETSTSSKSAIGEAPAAEPSSPDTTPHDSGGRER